MSVKVVDDIVTKDFQNAIEEELLYSRKFPWFFNPSTVDDELNYFQPHLAVTDSSIDTPQLYHFILSDQIPSPFFEFLKPMIYSIEEKFNFQIIELIRIKANLLLRVDKTVSSYHHPHVDMSDNDYKSLIYYVNDADGDTHVFNEFYNGTVMSKLTALDQISPKKGRAVLLESSRFHSSSPPIDLSHRCVINFVFKTK